MYTTLSAGSFSQAKTLVLAVDLLLLAQESALLSKSGFYVLLVLLLETAIDGLLLELGVEVPEDLEFFVEDDDVSLERRPLDVARAASAGAALAP